MSFGISLSGLDASTSDLDVIANNISNSNTTGFKSSRADFADVYAQGSLSLSANQVGEGVTVQQVQQQFSQGNISQTGNSLDLALNGNGFFMTKGSNGINYTRNGTFSLNAQGYLVDGSGNEVQAYPAVAGTGVAGAPTSFDQGALSSLQLTPTMNTPQATTTGTLGVNLEASTALPQDYATFSASDPLSYTSTTSTAVYDSLGTQHTVSFYFVPTPSAAPVAATPNTWNVYTTVDGTQTSATPQKLVFNSSGALTSPTPPTVTVNATAASLGDGAAAMSMAFNVGSTTQFGSAFGVNSITQNGYSSGQVTGVAIGTTGIVSATYSNGQSIDVGQLALANFPNPAGLAPTGNSDWTQTADSGAPVEGTAGSSNLGSIQSGALESSNVDLTKELVNMIVAQRAYQANAQMITTDDQLTQTVLAIRQG